MTLVLGMLVFLVVVFVDTIPPRSMTHTAMHMMKRRILRYATDNGSLPTSLDQLPRIEGYSNEVTDGWGRSILWRVEEDVVTLTSYGRHGLPGGTGEEAEMFGVFCTKTVDGHWADELCEWRHDPFATTK